MSYSKGFHTTFYHRFYVVWATKYSYRVLHGAIREIIRQTCNELGGHILKGVLAQDHVHMFLSVPPNIALSKVIQRIKGRSSRVSRWSSRSCENAIGAGVFGPVGISRQPREM